MTGPIDFWDNAIIPSFDESCRVLAYMPEPARDGNVYKIYIPNPNSSVLEPVYLCKADNNGTVYIFSEIQILLKTYYFEELKN
jgi:hypothetical protein